VEVFRDENKGRCLRCGHKFLAPGGNLGCAQWCSVAKECLGFAPQRQPSSGSTESALAARLIQRAEEVFKNHPARVAQVLRVFQFAKELVREEGGDPRVILCAALLLATGGESQASSEATSVDVLLREMGLDEATRSRVLEVVANYRTGQNSGAAELRIVCDAERLARLAVEPLVGSPDERDDAIRAGLCTEAGRRKARSLMQA
jgi:hypothetical protein